VGGVNVERPQPRERCDRHGDECRYTGHSAYRSRWDASQRISRISTHSSGALYPGFSPTTLGPTISSGTHRYAVASPSEVGWVGGWRGDAIAFRFQSPPVEPCMRLSGSKLSARTSTPLAWLVTFLKAVLRSRTVGFPESGF
jgi:hypothetical protein